MTSTCDVLVIGGGPAGSTAAALLARLGLSVVLLERKTFPRRKVCGEYLSATNWSLLTELGLADQIACEAGPEVRRVGLFVGDQELTADLPLAVECRGRWGRALSRERLDAMLIQRAAESGVDVRQPWDAKSLSRDGHGFLCRAVSAGSGEIAEISTGMVIAAHGSWEVGKLPTQPVRPSAKAGDLLGFKAHFQNSVLPEDLMPLLCFPGGYGGMARMEGGRMSLSCCIRRDQLGHIQSRAGRGDGDAVQAHIEATTPAVRRILANSTIEGHWLSAGPIRPGIRTGYDRGIVCIGNVAGEAHPAVAEGITMAMQSAHLLVEQVAVQRGSLRDPATRDVIGLNYARAWRAAFARRVRASSLIAHWAMRPRLVRASLPLLRRFPDILTWGARQSGKADALALPAAFEPIAGAFPLERVKS